MNEFYELAKLLLLDNDNVLFSLVGKPQKIQ